LESDPETVARYCLTGEAITNTPCPFGYSCGCGLQSDLDETINTLLSVQKNRHWLHEQCDQLRAELSAAQDERDRFFRELSDTQTRLINALAVIDVGTSDDPGTALAKVEQIQAVARANAIRECVAKVSAVSVFREEGDKLTQLPAIDYKVRVIDALESLTKKEGDNGPTSKA
jgi:hypothetical protein